LSYFAYGCFLHESLPYPILAGLESEAFATVEYVKNSIAAVKDGSLQTGLNAEKLNGISLANILSTRNGEVQTQRYSGDLNLLDSSGFYYCDGAGGTAINKPGNFNGFLINNVVTSVATGLKGAASQIFTTVDVQGAWIRRYASATWSNWVSITGHVEAFTPFFCEADSGQSIPVTYNTRSCSYIRIGRLVHVFIHLAGTWNAASFTGHLIIKGLPFVVNTGTIGTIGYVTGFRMTAPYTVRTHSDYLLLYDSRTTGYDTITTAQAPANGTNFTMMIAGAYIVAATA